MWVFIFFIVVFVCVHVRGFSVGFLVFSLFFVCFGGFRFVFKIHLFSTSDI